MLLVFTLACIPQPTEKAPDFDLLSENCLQTRDPEICYAAGDHPSVNVSAPHLATACTSGHRDACERAFANYEARKMHGSALVAASKGCEHGKIEMCRAVLSYGDKHADAAEYLEHVVPDAKKKLAELEAATP